MNRLPTCFAFLAGDDNAAVDAALVEAIPRLEPEVRQEAWRLLAQRGDGEALSTMVATFPDLEDEVRQTVVSGAHQIASVLRRSLRSTRKGLRQGAVDLVVTSGDHSLAYILAEALMVRDRTLQQQAGAGLRAWIKEWLTQARRRVAEGEPAKREGRVFPEAESSRHLSMAVGTAVESWDGHRRPEVMDVMMWMSDQVIGSVRRKCANHRSRFVTDTIAAMTAVIKPSRAGFVMHALSIEALAPTSVEIIAANKDSRFGSALLEHGFLLCDPAVRAGFRHVREMPWITSSEQFVAGLSGRQALSAVDFVCASGMTRKRQFEVFKSWFVQGGEALREAVMWTLIGDDHETSTALLRELGCRAEGRAALLIARELDRRAGKEPALDETGMTAPAPNAPSTQEDPLDRLWYLYDDIDPPGRRRLLTALLSEGRSVEARIRTGLGSQDPRDRVRALTMAREAGLLEAVDREVYRLARDPDDMVRSKAVILLAQLPGGASRRILKDSVSDANERVRANAIEALDALDADDRTSVTAPHLESRDPRVRANAIRSLLRVELAEAGEALIAMLEDESPMHRISALWVVEHLHLPSLVQRVEMMAGGDREPRVQRRARRLAAALQSVRRPRPAHGGATT